jgi:hypothetical protein
MKVLPFRGRIFPSSFKFHLSKLEKKGEHARIDVKWTIRILGDEYLPIEITIRIKWHCEVLTLVVPIGLGSSSELLEKQ